MKPDLRAISATLLWKCGAVGISVDHPYRLTSRNMSPIYIDCRRLISYPVARGLITGFAHWICENEGFQIDCIAGGESGGISYAAWLAQRMGKPMIYVRKKAKGHGGGSRIEGMLETGSSVLLYDDLVTDGASKLGFTEAIEQAGGEVKECLVVFDRQQGGRGKLAGRGVKLYSLCDMETALRVGCELERIDSDAFESVNSYLQDPEAWHVAHGYRFHSVR